MSYPVIGVVLVNYNGLALNVRCIDSILAQESVDLALYFVDNASTDGSLEQVRERYSSSVNCITNTKNMYFASGANTGVRAALADGCNYLFLINNDTELTLGCLKSLLDYLMQSDEVLGVQPLLVQMDDPSRIASAGCCVALMGGAWDALAGRHIEDIPETTLHFAGITGGAVLWRAEAFREIGFFDEDFVMYFEDVDYSLRARKHGYQLATLPAACVRHIGHGSTGATVSALCVRLCTANAMRLVTKHWPSRLVAKAVALYYIFCLLTCTSALIRRKTKLFHAVAIGCISGTKLLLRHLLRAQPETNNEDLSPWISTHCYFPPKTL